MAGEGEEGETKMSAREIKVEKKDCRERKFNTSMFYFITSKLSMLYITCM